MKISVFLFVFLIHILSPEYNTQNDMTVGDICPPLPLNLFLRFISQPLQVGDESLILLNYIAENHTARYYCSIILIISLSVCFMPSFPMYPTQLIVSPASSWRMPLSAW